MAEILVDTDLLIDLANNDLAAKKHLVAESQRATLTISVITQMELVMGCRNKKELEALNKLLLQFQSFQLSENISIKAEQLVRAYYLSHGLRIPDALIAATAIEFQIPLLSKNQRDYRFIQDLNLLPYS